MAHRPRNLRIAIDQGKPSDTASIWVAPTHPRSRYPDPNPQGRAHNTASYGQNGHDPAGVLSYRASTAAHIGFARPLLCFGVELFGELGDRLRPQEVFVASEVANGFAATGSILETPS